VVPWRGPAIFHAEFARTIDLVISIGNAFKGFHRQLLYTDNDALAVRRCHPMAAKLKRRETFLAARHVGVIIRGQAEDLIDAWLRTKGIDRHISLVVPGYLEALHVAARTDLVAFVPRRLIAALSKQLGLVTVTPPLDPGDGNCISGWLCWGGKAKRAHHFCWSDEKWWARRFAPLPTLQESYAFCASITLRTAGRSDMRLK
jgi:DNA-binding transcriptional LysR family regulator